MKIQNVKNVSVKTAKAFLAISAGIAFANIQTASADASVQSISDTAFEASLSHREGSELPVNIGFAVRSRGVMTPNLNIAGVALEVVPEDQVHFRTSLVEYRGFSSKEGGDVKRALVSPISFRLDANPKLGIQQQSAIQLGDYSVLVEPESGRTGSLVGFSGTFLSLGSVGLSPDEPLKRKIAFGGLSEAKVGFQIATSDNRERLEGVQYTMGIRDLERSLVRCEDNQTLTLTQGELFAELEAEFRRRGYVRTQVGREFVQIRDKDADPSLVQKRVSNHVEVATGIKF